MLIYVIIINERGSFIYYWEQRRWKTWPSPCASILKTDKGLCVVALTIPTQIVSRIYLITLCSLPPLRRSAKNLRRRIPTRHKAATLQLNIPNKPGLLSGLVDYIFNTVTFVYNYYLFSKRSIFEACGFVPIFIFFLCSKTRLLAKLYLDSYIAVPYSI